MQIPYQLDDTNNHILKYKSTVNNRLSKAKKLSLRMNHFIDEINISLNEAERELVMTELIKFTHPLLIKRCDICKKYYIGRSFIVVTQNVFQKGIQQCRTCFDKSCK